MRSILLYALTPVLLFAACGGAGDDATSTPRPATPLATNAPGKTPEASPSGTSTTSVATAQATAASVTTTPTPGASATASATTGTVPPTEGAASRTATSQQSQPTPTSPAAATPTPTLPPPPPPTPTPIPTPPSGGPLTATVEVANYVFRPASQTVGVGGTVTWAWSSSDTAHDVVVPGLGDSGSQKSGSFSITFSKAGTYSYYCSLHITGGKNMRGTIRVE